jgi:molecular chaperone DnaK
MISNIIFRNEVLPIVSTKTYYPVEDGQTSIRVEIFENSASNDADGKRIDLIDGYSVGEFEMDLPDGTTRSTPITVKFVATDEGILVSHVDCMSQHTEYQLQNKLQMSDADIKSSQGLMEKVSKGD